MNYVTPYQIEQQRARLMREFQESAAARPSIWTSGTGYISGLTNPYSTGDWITTTDNTCPAIPLTPYGVVTINYPEPQKEEYRVFDEKFIWALMCLSNFNSIVGWFESEKKATEEAERRITNEKREYVVLKATKLIGPEPVKTRTKTL